jgi:hypothetical protein
MSIYEEDSFSEFINSPPWTYWHLSKDEVRIWLIGLGVEPQHAILLSENDLDETLEGLDLALISEILGLEYGNADAKKYEARICENYESLRYLNDDKWGGNLEKTPFVSGMVQQFFLVELKLWMDLLKMSETDTGIKLVEFMCGVKPQILDEEFESLKEHYRDLPRDELSRLVLLRNYTYNFGFPFEYIFDKEKSSMLLEHGIRNDSWEKWEIHFKELYRGAQ